MSKYKLIIFDWDGTLADSRQSIVKCVQKTAKEIGFSIPTSNKISNGIGLSMSAQMERLFPKLEHEKFISSFRKNYEIYKDFVDLFPGVLETLQYLQNTYLLAIATSKRSDDLLKMLQQFSIDGFFCSMRCGDAKIVKPDPKVLLSITEELSISPKESIFVGDSEYDMLTAQRAHLDAIAVNYGVHNEQQLLKYSPKALLHSFPEIKNILNNQEQNHVN